MTDTPQKPDVKPVSPLQQLETVQAKMEHTKRLLPYAFFCLHHHDDEIDGTTQIGRLQDGNSAEFVCQKCHHRYFAKVKEKKPCIIDLGVA